MTPEIILTLAIIAGAILLFALELLRVDLVALLVLLAVTLTGLVGPDEAFAGFSNSAVITVWAVYIVSGGLFRTGVADMMGQFIMRLAGSSEARLVAVIMLTCGILSAFINNVGATAMLLPAVVAISRQSNIPVSRLLIPLAFSSLLGGKMTLIGTPANILATNILIDQGLPTYGFFDFTPIGIVVLGTGVIYMVLVGRHLLPERQSVEAPEVVLNQLRAYVSEVFVPESSELAGKTLLEARLGADYDLNVLAIIRDGKPSPPLRRDTVIQANDLLVLEGPFEDLIEASAKLDLEIEAERKTKLEEIQTEEEVTIEATLAPRSNIGGRSLRQIRFRERYGYTALAIWRHGEVIRQRLRDVPLEFGDALLLKGPRQRLRALQEEPDFLVLEPVELVQRRGGKAPLAAGIMVGVVGLVIFANLSISTAMVIGAVMMVLTRSLTMEEAYESIDWRTVFLVAGMLPLGTAMEATGTARFLADLLLGAVGDFGPIAVLAGIYILAALITQPMSNAAAMVLVVPIAVDTAASLGANHLTFTMATVIGAATSFLTPVGHKANVLVFGPGGYRFFDYTRVGAPLTILLLIVSMIAIPIIWPMFP